MLHRWMSVRDTDQQICTIMYCEQYLLNTKSRNSVHFNTICKIQLLLAHSVSFLRYKICEINFLCLWCELKKCINFHYLHFILNPSNNFPQVACLKTKEEFSLHYWYISNNLIYIFSRIHILLEPSKAGGEKVFRAYDMWYKQPLLTESTTFPIIGKVHQMLRIFTAKFWFFLGEQGLF